MPLPVREKPAVNGTTTAVIYGLTDPRDGSLRYIGKTIGRLKDRLSGHLCDVRPYHPERKRLWLDELRALGLCPEIFEIEPCPRTSALEQEAFWIGYFRFCGAALVNERPYGVTGCKRNLDTTNQRRWSRYAGVNRRREKAGLPRMDYRLFEKMWERDEDICTCSIKTLDAYCTNAI